MSIHPNRDVRFLGRKESAGSAIVAIGPQVLVLTRPDANALHMSLTAAFVQWTLFQCPGINLEEIQIPIRKFPSGKLPTRAEIEGMIQEIRANCGFGSQIEPAMWTKINEELGSFDVDAQAIGEELGEPRLTGDGRGTHFLVMPTDPSLTAAIDGAGENDAASPLKKMLLGFTNTMTPNHPPAQIHAAFRDHKTNDTSEELIDEQSFFTPEEYSNADHHILGRFDEFGNHGHCQRLWRGPHKSCCGLGGGTRKPDRMRAFRNQRGLCTGCFARKHTASQ